MEVGTVQEREIATPWPVMHGMAEQRRAAPRPLAGHTVLVVEDSRLASAALRIMCLRSGARVRHADSLRAARRHLGVYRPDVALVDMGLPDGSGADLIAILARTSPNATMILATSGDPARESEARDAGASGFLSKPLPGLAAFQRAVLAHLQVAVLPAPRAVEVAPELDPRALRDDLAHGAHLLSISSDPAALQYVAGFLRGIARTTRDARLEQAAQTLHRLHGADAAARLSHLVQLRLERATMN